MERVLAHLTMREEEEMGTPSRMKEKRNGETGTAC
jgi:hypothetical protein